MTALDYSGGFGPSMSYNQALMHPAAYAVLERHSALPASEEERYALASYPLGIVIRTAPALMNDPARQAAVLDDLAALPATSPRRGPSPDGLTFTVSDTAATPSVTHPESVSTYGRFELRIDGITGDHPYAVQFGAWIDGPGGRVWVPGYWHEADSFRIRFMPPAAGAYRFATTSGFAQLDGHAGTFDVTAAAPGAHGPVRAQGFHFAHTDGAPYLPIGTTAYAWLFQPEEMQERTLRALAASPFNKLRMCLFPKWFAHNVTEPEVAPFERGADGRFQFDRPDPLFWALLERRIEQLDRLGIQADLIFFHPYDRWGFTDMGRDADLRYVSYAVARLAAYANVWWSLANEHDVIPTKNVDDWETIAAAVTTTDPAGHLRSIHHCLEFYDHGRPWITHASIQRADIERVPEWRARWGKPVVLDECGYEGDLPYTWGNLTAQEMVHRHWAAAARGAYGGHGETYADPDDRIWWSSGGDLHGESPDRIAFLASIMREHPHPWEPIPGDASVPTIGKPGAYYLAYLGSGQSTDFVFVVDPTATYTVDVIDTWAMTIRRVAAGVTGRVQVELPGHPGIAVRFVAES